MFETILAIFTPQIILLCLFCVAVTGIIKAYLHLRWPQLKTNLYARKVYFPALPLIVGAMAAFATRGETSPAQAILEGVGAGLSSGFMFTLIKGLIKGKVRGEK